MLRLDSKKHDLGGGMIVRRVLPQRLKRMIGPFVFLDHMGPVIIEPDQNTDVRPHPHIGLSTLTYLFSGRIMHRDSLGTVASIESGEVNWMTAGHGISHSERAFESDRKSLRELHGLQFWIALPDDQEDCDPEFHHYGYDEIPKIKNDHYELTVIAGEGFGLKSPVTVTSPLILVDIKCLQKCSLKLPWSDYELAVYVISGQIKIGQELFNSFQMAVLDKNTDLTVEAQIDTHYIVIGGKPMATVKHIWWNLVSSSKEKIENAKMKWKNGEFPMVPEDNEFIEMPD